MFEERSKQSSNVSIYQLDKNVSLGECLNFGITRARYPYIAKMDDDDYYSPYYLMEAYQEMKRTKTHIIGKSSIYTYFQDDQLLCEYNKGFENIYLNSNHVLIGATLVVDKVVFEEIEFPQVNLGEDLGFQRLCKLSGLSLYSTSKYNYAYIRYNGNGHHTSDSSNHRLRRKCKIVTMTDNYKLFVDKEFN